VSGKYFALPTQEKNEKCSRRLQPAKGQAGKPVPPNIFHIERTNTVPDTNAQEVLSGIISPRIFPFPRFLQLLPRSPNPTLLPSESAKKGRASMNPAFVIYEDYL
jgi:hypothetical protein